ncbi:putative ent-kaurene synthase [Helianthus annuus]|nr:putative ent-kaurene synthase [Helianthus annuus]KAJ0646048.1 putative ent-kaurene synthase [Helianthus annuus]KAJ0822682.1 putative ent-kaurene synthase [Helianthus annuus]
MTMIPTYLAYNSEGLGNLYDWHMVKNYQMKNGYVFNSPSATAAGFINHQDVGCLNYLNSLWTSLVIQRDEQIFMDVVTCALDFRLLRISGYEVSSEITNEGAFKDEYAAVEVYNVSQVLYPEELSFGEQILKSGDFPKRIISTDSNRLSKCKEVDWRYSFQMAITRCKSHVIQNWLDAMNSALREAMWTRDAYVPTTNEYMENAYVLFASGPIGLPLFILWDPNCQKRLSKASSIIIYTS